MRSVNEYINTTCVDCRYKTPAFFKLTETQLLQVDDNRTELTFKKAELLAKQGTFMSQIIFVKKGFVKLYRENSDSPAILSIVKPGSFIGVQALFGEPVFPFSAEALTDTEVCLLDIDIFRALVLENADFAKEIIETLNSTILNSYNRLYSLTTKHINGRLLELLLFMSKVLYKSNPFRLTISRKDMADLISTSPESISRLMSEFKELGLIKVKGHDVEILDEARLDTICKYG
jgi:CRP/FNR family transcriptional regulator, polysaccharide utilization system transcription regulator